MRVNTIKRKLLQGTPAFGAEAAFGAPLVAETLAFAGFDFVQVDTQHGEWSPERMMAAFRSICLGGATPTARVQHNDYATIGAVMDLGALGIVVPMVNSAEEATRAVRAAFYPPHGDRSNGPIGAAIHGTQAEYLREIRAEALVIVQIETREAAECAGEILAVDGVDGCMIGPSDLRYSMGVPFGSREHERAIEGVLNATRKAGKIPGIASWGSETNSPWRRAEQGFLFIQAASDRELVPKGAQELLARLKPLRG